MFDQFSKSRLIVAFALTPPIKPLVKQVSQLIFKATEASPVPCHTVVVIVADQLPIQFSKQYLLRQTTVFLKPDFEIRYCSSEFVS